MRVEPATTTLPDGLHVFVKSDCPTCRLVVPALVRLVESGRPVTIHTQDDPSFPSGLPVVDDTELELSFRASIEIVPTLLKVAGGSISDRVEGWLATRWEELTQVPGLGAGMPPHKPGCGSRTVDPGMPETLAWRYGGERVRSRRIEVAALEDEAEVPYRRGWTDGLPVIPPTPERVLRMLAGTDRDPQEVVATVPPDMARCTVEKVAVNAVMAGCLPEYLPVVLAAVEAACTPEFNLHALVATTWAAGPVVIVNGPLAGRLGMNSGMNVLGQGNRANASIGRALQLVVRNVGGGRPGEIDRATLGGPGKFTFCFAEDEAGSPWEPLSVARGFPPGVSTVTLFAGESPRGVIDQLSREPESLARSYAACLRTVAHPKQLPIWDAILVVSPEHGRVFRQAGWSRARLLEELDRLLQLPVAELVRGADGIAEGLPPDHAGATVPKFRPGGLMLVHAGGAAGLYSAIIGGSYSGSAGNEPVTKEIR